MPSIPDGGWVFSLHPVLKLRECNELPGAYRGALLNGTANSSTFGWTNPPLGLTPFPVAVEKDQVNTLDWHYSGTNLIQTDPFNYISARWGIGFSASSVFSCASLVWGNASIHRFGSSRLSRAAAPHQHWTGNQIVIYALSWCETWFWDGLCSACTWEDKQNSSAGHHKRFVNRSYQSSVRNQRDVI